ncbi:acyltransferase family protein [Nesterenkonia ebinurensis]|uniref:acyltransferase family protein n=1 Tax=Nesterenkonia ebinurensis TaxID=2608252 RepID=UPI00123D4070|nr:acyltransferase family protein [Nesterenkonia ebinurensis]
MPTKNPEPKLLQGLPERSYRPELHGVRGLAILGVVLFHLFGQGRVSGGIDIFLTISGFLFTAMLLREAAELGGKIRLGHYFARLSRRILPPAALVVAVTAVAGYFILPSTQHHQLFREARASLLYFENIELINSQLSYDAAGPDSSPFQHFWSLSVQGQFYLIWPVVAVLAVLLARGLQRSATNTMTMLVCLVFAASFTYALIMGTVNQDEAYLMTRTRLWELAFGGLLALAGARLTLPKPLRLPAGWAGFTLIVLCGFFLDGAQLFPGPWALWPLAGLALVLASTRPGDTDADTSFSAVRILSARPFAWLGGIAYGLYLWHWPVLIFWLQLRETDHVGPFSGAAVLLISLTLAWVSLSFVEKPFARPRRRRARVQVSLAAGVLIIGGAGASAAVTHTAVTTPTGYAMSEVDHQIYPGAAVTGVGANEAPADVDFIPTPEELAIQAPLTAEWGCVQTGQQVAGAHEVLVCEDPERPEDPAATIVLSGGSHSVHWHAAFTVLAEANNWELLVISKNGCRFGVHTANEQCASWQDEFMDVLAERAPDVVVTTGTVSFGSDSEEHIHRGAPERWAEITDTGAELLLLRGIVRPDQNVADCLALHGASPECGAHFGSYAETNPLLETDLPQSAYVLDLTPHICPDQSCPPVVGNVAVYRDESHFSNHYMETLVPFIDEQLREEMPHLYEQ